MFLFTAKLYKTVVQSPWKLHRWRACFSSLATRDPSLPSVCKYRGNVSPSTTASYYPYTFTLRIQCYAYWLGTLFGLNQQNNTGISCLSRETSLSTHKARGAETIISSSLLIVAVSLPCGIRYKQATWKLTLKAKTNIKIQMQFP